MRIRSLSILSCAIVLLVGIVPAQARGQAIDILPPPPIVSVAGITVDEHSVQANIEGPIAEVVVTQVFRNDSDRLVEGTFLFPLPEDAAVGDFQMTVNGQVLEGQVMDSDRARQIYEETVRQIRDPALLEYAGRGLFKTSVFPIPPGETRTLEFRYGVLLDAENGLHRFTYPLRLPGASRPANRTELVVDIKSDDGPRAIYSPSHDVDVDRTGDNKATIRFESMGEPFRSDFELYYGLGADAVSLNLISNKPAGEDGYFVLLAAPSVEVESDEVVERDVVFVVDVSGSMEGPKLAQAKDAVQYVVERLNPGDRFNLIAFSTGASLWSEHLADVTPDTVDDALAWIEGLDASGSTDINRALLEALGQIGSGDTAKGAPGYVLFMTDGLPTQGEIDIEKIIRNAQLNLPDDASIRLFTFGVGFDVNTDLLDTLSQDLGGRSRYVRPDEKIDEAVSDFYTTIQTPVLTDVELDFGSGVAASDLFPYPLPDLFAGEQLVVTGRYRHGGDTTVSLRGDVGGENAKYVYPDLSLVTAGGDPFVARLWATRKIGALMAEIRRNGPDPELVDAIVDLSMRYGIVTPYTSYLVEEPEGQARAFDAPAADGGVRRREALLSGAKDSVFAAAEEEAAAPSSGEVAVQASIERQQLRMAEGVTEHQEVRFAGDRTFVNGGYVVLPDGVETTLWVDTSYSDDMNLETVAFGSDRYFELASNPDIAEVLSLSTEVLFALDDVEAVRVTTDPTAESTHDAQIGSNTATDVPTDVPTGVDAVVDAETSRGGFWGTLMGWLEDKVK